MLLRNYNFGAGGYRGYGGILEFGEGDEIFLGLQNWDINYMSYFLPRSIYPSLLAL